MTAEEGEAPAPTPGRTVARAVWTTADQAVSSLSNAALTIVLATSVSAAEFGTFALAFSVYTFLIGVSQALGAQVVVIRFSIRPADERDGAVALAAGTSVLVGLAGFVLLLATTALVDLPSGRILVVLAVLLPALLLQDTWRTVLIARGNPEQAFVNDLLWTALQLVLVPVLLLAGVVSATPYVAVWGLSALVSAALGIRQARVRPELCGIPEWLRAHSETSRYLLAQWVAVLGATQVAFVAVAAIGTVEAVGSLRAALTLLGPLNIIGMAATSFAVPEMVRRGLSRKRLVQAALVLSGGLLLVDGLWGGLLLLLPPKAGVALLGETWGSARDALPGMVVFTCAIGATVGTAAVCRAVDQTRYIFLTSAVLGPLILVLSVAGQALAGSEGAAWGFAFAAVLVIPLAWVFLAGALRDRP